MEGAMQQLRRYSPIKACDKAFQKFRKEHADRQDVLRALNGIENQNTDHGEDEAAQTARKRPQGAEIQAERATGTQGMRIAIWLPRAVFARGTPS